MTSNGVNCRKRPLYWVECNPDSVGKGSNLTNGKEEVQKAVEHHVDNEVDVLTKVALFALI